MNSRNKGKVGEREFAALLREHGYDARRGQQFSGSPESPDVVSPALPWLHIEVKRVQNLNLTDACVQAEGDAGGKPWIVAHRRNHAPWLITMRADTFFRLLRGELPPDGTDSTPHPDPLPDRGGEGASGTGDHCDGTNRTEATAHSPREMESGCSTSSGLRPPSPQRGEETAREDSRPTKIIFRRDAEKDSRDGCATNNNQN